MENEYKHLSANVTAIFCKHRNSGKEISIFIDTDDFERVSSYEGTWRLYKASNNESFFVSIHNKGTQTQLKRLLTNVLNNPDKHVTFINKDPFDFRKCNLFVATSKKIHLKQTKEKIKAAAKRIPELPNTYQDTRKEFFTTREIAEKLGVETHNIRKWADKFDITHKKNKSGKFLFTSEQVSLFTKIKNTSKKLSSSGAPSKYVMTKNFENDEIWINDRKSGQKIHIFKNQDEILFYQDILSNINLEL
ncbi:MerR family transcriptional regulator [Bacillus altitudinis]|uniref:MerR family transcriptional regulator n=1 Tax=Bacillus altitudinis TaxID=293387 RepID=UPI0035DC70BA